MINRSVKARGCAERNAGEEVATMKHSPRSFSPTQTTLSVCGQSVYRSGKSATDCFFKSNQAAYEAGEKKGREHA
jgi:hypothetical protein